MENLVRKSQSLTELVERKRIIKNAIIDHKLENELDAIERKMLKNEYQLINLEFELIDLELKRDAIIATSK